jgi:hypothetical protein
MRQITLGAVTALIAVLLLTGSALAGKQTSSLSLVVVGSAEITASSAVEPSQGGQITFDVSTTQTDRPFVNVRCYQGGSWVYDGWHGFFESYVPDPVYTLSSLGWTAGEADCTASLVMWTKSARLKTLATTSFHVSA